MMYWISCELTMRSFSWRHVSRHAWMSLGERLEMTSMRSLSGSEKMYGEDIVKGVVSSRPLGGPSKPSIGILGVQSAFSLALAHSSGSSTLGRADTGSLVNGTSHLVLILRIKWCHWQLIIQLF